MFYETLTIITYIILSLRINCEITIIGPKDLISKFSSDTLDLEYSNFGRLPSDFTSRGEIIIDSSNESEKECSEFEENFIIDNQNLKVIFR